MILSLAILIGLVASLVRHRRHAASRIAAIQLRDAWLALLAVALQLPLLRAPLTPIERLGLQQVLFLLSHLLLLAFVWRNRRLAGIRILGFGVICNLVAIATNGGFMPITPETLVQINPGTTAVQWPLGVHYGFSKDIILSQEATRLWLLSDILVVPPPFPWPTAFSLGDLLIGAGIIILLQGPRTASKPVLTESRAALQ
jgi:hypothetical protein